MKTKPESESESELKRTVSATFAFLVLSAAVLIGSAHGKETGFDAGLLRNGDLIFQTSRSGQSQCKNSSSSVSATRTAY